MSNIANIPAVEKTIHDINAAIDAAEKPHADHRYADALMLGRTADGTDFNVGTVFLEQEPGRLARIARVASDYGDVEYLSNTGHANVDGMLEVLLVGIRLGLASKQVAAASA